jgi:hypothetical protein
MIGKFKVWNKLKKEFDTNAKFFIDQNGDLHVIGMDGIMKCGVGLVPVHSTGKTDKNGVELFFGDHVKCLLISGHEVRTICFFNGETEVLNTKTGAHSHMNAGHYYEKIGTKFENPELLETEPK